MAEVLSGKMVSGVPSSDGETSGAANSFLIEAMADDKREGQRLAVRARWVALGVIALLLPYLIPAWNVLYYEALLLGFAIIGWAQLKIGRVGRSRAELLLIFCDLALMTFTLVVPNPMDDYPWPLAMQYRLDNFLYFFVLLAGATLAHSWRTIITVGVWTSGLWILALVIIMFQPAALPELTEAVKVALAGYPEIFSFLDPNSVNTPARIQEIVVFLIVAGILALGGRRTNRLLVRQAAAARERSNLARHFPPNIVDRLADRDRPFGQVRSQPVAVMFADIVGFTQFAERHSPDQVVTMLREFHTRMEHAVFDHEGTLDKFLGDGLMATFGTPDPGPRDALNALCCARAMVQGMDEWNRLRVGSGAEPIPLSIGIHHGDVVLGEVGSERRLEFAVLGDTVNVASRLEALTRRLGVQVVLSDQLVQAVRAEAGAGAEETLAGFQRGERQALKGRDESVLVWMGGIRAA